jgi:hypothetical protein
MMSERIELLYTRLAGKSWGKKSHYLGGYVLASRLFFYTFNGCGLKALPIKRTKLSKTSMI